MSCVIMMRNRGMHGKRGALHLISHNLGLYSLTEWRVSDRWKNWFDQLDQLFRSFNALMVSGMGYCCTLYRFSTVYGCLHNIVCVQVFDESFKFYRV